MGQDLRQWLKNDMTQWTWNIPVTKLDSAWQAVDRDTRHWWGDIEGFFIDIGGGIKNGLDSAWQAVDRDVRHWWGDVEGFVLDSGGAIKNFFTGPFVDFFTKTLPGVFNGAGTWLVNAGKAIVGGIVSGVKWGWDVVQWFFAVEVPAFFTHVFDGAKTWLINAGNAVIQGLWDGMKSTWDHVTGWLGSLGGAITHLKGPYEKDLTLLVENGNAIMQGLGHGLRQGFAQHVLPAISEATRQMQSGYNTKLTGPSFALNQRLGAGVSLSDRIAPASAVAASVPLVVSPSYGGIAIHGADLSNPAATKQAVEEALAEHDAHLVQLIGANRVGGTKG